MPLHRDIDTFSEAYWGIVRGAILEHNCRSDLEVVQSCHPWKCCADVREILKTMASRVGILHICLYLDILSCSGTDRSRARRMWVFSGIPLSTTNPYR